MGVRNYIRNSILCERNELEMGSIYIILSYYSTYNYVRVYMPSAKYEGVSSAKCEGVSSAKCEGV